MRTITRVVVGAVALALVGCGSEDDAASADAATVAEDDGDAADGGEDGGGDGAPDELEAGTDGADDLEGPADRPPLACPSVATVSAITGVDITGHSGPAAGDPTPLHCQYTGDDPQFRTGTAVYVDLDPVDDGPAGFGRSVAGLGEWAEVAAEEGVIYVGFGDGVLEIGTYADLSDDQLIDLVEATLEAGAAAG